MSSKIGKAGNRKREPIDADFFLDPKNHKVRVTTFIDGDVLDELKKRAAAEGSKYQTLMNHLLRQSLFESKSLSARLKKLEDAVFKKKKAV